LGHQARVNPVSTREAPEATLKAVGIWPSIFIKPSLLDNSSQSGQNFNFGSTAFIGDPLKKLEVWENLSIRIAARIKESGH